MNQIILNQINDVLRKDHSSTKEELEYLTAEYSDNKMKLERSTTRISSLKEQNDVLRQERHRWLEKANTASFSPTFSSTSLRRLQGYIFKICAKIEL